MLTPSSPPDGERQAASASSSSRRQEGVEPCWILLADNDRALCDSLAGALRRQRYRVDVVHDGPAALQACARGSHDVLLLDVDLAGVSGSRIIPRIEEIRPQLDILVMTGRASVTPTVSAVSRSTNGYLVKPLDLDQLLVILAGIAQRRQIAKENKLLLASLEERNAELERYAYTVSHDLRSPLITIKGFLGLAQRHFVDGKIDELPGFFRQIEDAASKMIQLLDELLELSRVGRIANPTEDLDLAELAREAIERVAGPEIRERIEFLVAGEMPGCRGDRIRLLEVLQNLIENAIKFMGDQADPRIVIGARAEGGKTVYFVADNGIGIDPVYRDRVFGMFDKLNPRAHGTGIGLALVKRIVEVHRGRVWMESDGPGRGATFCFTIDPAG